MPFLTIPAVFRVVFALALVVGLVGCVPTPKPPPKPNVTSMQLREMQSREYEGTNMQNVMKAVIAALQDEGFIISEAAMELGLITAAQEIYEVDEATKNYVEFWWGSGVGTYQTTKRLEASVTVREHGKKIRVRLNVVAKALSNAGGIIWSQPVYNPEAYQKVFAKIDKALYLEKEKI
ncbi:MAG: hypothetical protein PVG03_00975 [Desulfarculaceae bacterium]|jgi:hypothetical protein